MQSPPTLQPGDLIAIVSTARSIQQEDLNQALKIFADWGLKVKLGKHLFHTSGQFAGTDAERISDMQAMLDDPSVKAVLCARGGYGTTRIIDHLDFSSLRHAPKWIIGFSDITALHGHLHNMHIQTIHSIMPALFGKEGATNDIQSLKEALFEKPLPIETHPHPLNRIGEAQGIVIGGNLSIINNIMATASDIDTEGKILFIEDIDEYLYHIDRMMVHLKRAKKLDHLAALVVGKMTGMRDNATPFGIDANTIIFEHISEFKYPVCFDFPVGHEVSKNKALICGRTAQLKVTSKQVHFFY